ncbi:MAG: uracil phosphoribosyltransferase [Alphaproteobacteria bacterium]|nr:uracil phosphoribosyltransferase [Alphaproteobacteria bacterium]
MPQVTVLNHPLVDVKMTTLRDAATPAYRFRQTLHEMAALMSAEVFRHLEVQPVDVTTPLEVTTGAALPPYAPCLVSILRAGNGLTDAFLNIFPEAAVGHLGMERDHDTHQARAYYEKLPPAIEKRQVILIDPMLATGGSAVMAAAQLRSRGVRDIVFTALVAAPEGVTAFHNAHPDIPVITAAMDRELNDNCYILPGLGDAGDRIINTQKPNAHQPR